MLVPALLATSLAVARAEDAPPVLAVRLEGGADVAGAPGTPFGAVAAGVGVPFGGGVTAEIEGVVGLDGAAAPRASGMLGARIPVVAGLSAYVGGGGGWRRGGPVPIGRAGVAYELPVGATRLRLGLQAEATPDATGLLLGAGFAFPLARRVEPAVVEAEPDPVEPLVFDDEPVEVNAPGALVWVPHPVCAWVPAEEAAALLAIADPELPAKVTAPGYVPTELPREGSRAVTLRAAPPFGAVVVVAAPGDEVSIEGAKFPLAGDGTAVFGAPEGTLRVLVRGAGRRVELEGAVAAGYALWLRAPAPEPLVVSFEPGSAAIPATFAERLRAFAADAGDHGFRIVGSFSNEADRGESRRLADQRAEALKAALLAAGVPARAIDVLSTAAPTADAPPDALRSARVEAILPKDGR